MRRTTVLTIGLLLGMAILPWPVLAADSGASPSLAGPSALAWLLPIGIALVAVGTSEPARAQRALVSLPLALMVAVVGYLACGFAFQFGGVGLVDPAPAYRGLLAEWSPLDLVRGTGWGLIGLRGFGLPAEILSEEVLELVLAQLPLVTMAAIIPLVAGGHRLPLMPSLLVTFLVACVCYPLAGNWIRGGGWLSQLGETTGLGQGFLDAGLSTYHLVGAGMALAVLVAFRRHEHLAHSTPQLPAAYLPLNLLVGAGLALIGWFVVVSGQPIGALGLPPSLLLLNTLGGVAGASLTSVLYGWLARGEPDSGLAGRGIVAGLVAVGPSLVSASFSEALLIGAVAGLLVPLTMYVVDELLELDDRAGALSIHGVPAMWGLLAVGLFASSSSGPALNALAGQNAQSGWMLPTEALLAAPRLTPDTGQLYAQISGILGILILCAAVPWVLLTLAAKGYALPAAARENLRQRVQQRREERDAMGATGARPLLPWQRLYALYLRNIARPGRRLRRRLLRQAPGSSAAPSQAEIRRRRLHDA